MQPGRQENLFSGRLIITGRKIKSKLTNICLTVCWLSVAAGCSVNDSAKTAGVRGENAAVQKQNSNATADSRPVNDENSNATVVKNASPKTLDCNDPAGYSFVIAKDPGRASQNSGTVPKILNVVVGDETKWAIKVPTDSDAMGFSMRPPEKTKEGFKIIIEYGSRNYYRKQLFFICKEGDFYLYKVNVESFDKNNPQSVDNWDRKEIKVEPNLPIEKFSIFDYLVN